MKLTKDDKAMLRSEYAKVWRMRDGSEDTKMVEHCTKSASGYIAFGDDICVMDKPHIQTDFWFGEHTYDYDEVCDYRDRCSESESYFRSKNLASTDAKRLIEAIDDGHEFWLCRKYGHLGESNLAYVQRLDPIWNSLRGDEIRRMDDAELALLRTFCEEEQAKFSKRIDTYLKRYGLSKCHYGVFWADR